MLEWGFENSGKNLIISTTEYGGFGDIITILYNI